jgi:hypothetical protein
MLDLAREREERVFRSRRDQSLADRSSIERSRNVAVDDTVNSVKIDSLYQFGLEEGVTRDRTCHGRLPEGAHRGRIGRLTHRSDCPSQKTAQIIGP